MKKIILATSIMAVILAAASLTLAWGPGYMGGPGFAQQSEPYGRRNFPVSDSPCWTKSYLEATPEQLKGLEGLQKSYFQEVLSLRKRQMDLRYELRALMEHPDPDTKRVVAKQNDLSAIQKQMDEVSVRYYLKGRGLFTVEQLSRMPSGCQLGFSYGPGRGGGPSRGRGWNKGTR